jgi:hypothetical protein
MGLFDLFKKSSATTSEPEKSEVPYLGDLDKTNVIFQLVNTPLEARDEHWQDIFLANLSDASFRCSEPQVITGPDGFPYFQLFLPEPGKNFQCYVIDKMKNDFLIRLGYGVVINPSPTHADWVLSYGDILNLHLNGTFYTKEQTPFSKVVIDEVIATNEEVMVAQPSEALLPGETRLLLHNFLKANGIETPKIALLMRGQNKDLDVSYDLAFNVTPHQFESEADYRMVMQSIAWFLPRHYSFVGMNENALSDGFVDL